MALAAVRHEEPDRLCVGGEILVPPTALGHGEVDDVVEIGRNPGEVTTGQVDRLAAHARLLEVISRRGVGEAGDAPHLVVGREGLGDWNGDLPGGAGDEDL